MSNTLNILLSILAIILLSSCVLGGAQNSPSNSQIVAAQYSNNKCLGLSGHFIAPANEIVALGKFVISRDNEPVNTKPWSSRPRLGDFDCKQLYYKDRVAINEVVISQFGSMGTIAVNGGVCEKRPLVHIYSDLSPGAWLQRFYNPIRRDQREILSRIKTVLEHQCSILPEAVDIKLRYLPEEIRNYHTIWNKDIFENIYEGVFYPNRKLDSALVDAKPEERQFDVNRFHLNNRARRPKGIDPIVAEEMAEDLMKGLPAVGKLIENAQCASAFAESPENVPSWCYE